MTQELTPFASLGLSNVLLRALDDLNFKTPSPIQEQSIPILLQGRDLIGQAQTGTGKTAAFALPILQNIELVHNQPQALVIAPTRELAIQVGEHFSRLSAHQSGLNVSVLCGGQDYRTQLKQLRAGAHIVVGTPGRILDHIDRGTLKLNTLKTFVLDEADEMLRMGFIEDVESILAKLPTEKQMALFSATMPSRIRQIANRYLTNPESVQIRSETATVKSIEQRFLFANQAQKPEALLRVLAAEDYQGVIVFVRTKSSADEVAEYLQQHQHRAMAIHGDLNQSARERIIAQFKKSSIDILVATDVAARGLDVDRVSHVINYDIAQDSETYVHRIGRTGRAGRSGITYLFVTPKESRMLNTIERHTKQRITKVAIPNEKTIEQARQTRFINQIKQRLESSHLSEYRTIIEDFMKQQSISAVDVAAALALLVNQDKSWKMQSAFQDMAPCKATRFQDKADAKSMRGSKKRTMSGAKSSRSDYPQALYRLDVGRIHGVKPGNIVGAIANEAGLQSRDITGLKIHDDHSLVRLPRDLTKETVKDLNKAWVCGRQLNLQALGAA